MVRSKLNSFSGSDPIWAFVALVGSERFTGEAAVGLDPRVRVYALDGTIYYAERDGDASIGSRLVDCGAISREQLERGEVQIGEFSSLSRLFQRDPSIDRDRVELTVSLATEALIEKVANKQVGMPEVFPLRHHRSGIHHWLRSATPILEAANEDETADDAEDAVTDTGADATTPALAPAVTVVEIPMVPPAAVEPPVIDKIPAMNGAPVWDEAVWERSFVDPLVVERPKEMVPLQLVPLMSATVDAPQTHADDQPAGEAVTQTAEVPIIAARERATFSDAVDALFRKPMAVPAAVNAPSEPVIDAVVEAVVEPVVEPVVEAVAEPLVRPVEPVVEPAASVSTLDLHSLPPLTSLAFLSSIGAPSQQQDTQPVEPARVEPVAVDSPFNDVATKVAIEATTIEAEPQPVSLLQLTMMTLPTLSAAQGRNTPAAHDRNGSSPVTESSASPSVAAEQGAPPANMPAEVIAAASALPRLATAPFDVLAFKQSAQAEVAATTEPETASLPSSVPNSPAAQIWDMVDDLLVPAAPTDEPLAAFSPADKRRSWMRRKD